MKIKQLCLEIAKREGKKKQVDIAQIKEIVSIFADIFYEGISKDYSLTYELFRLGSKRAKKKK